jgi:hypothetical protein
LAVAAELVEVVDAQQCVGRMATVGDRYRAPVGRPLGAGQIAGELARWDGGDPLGQGGLPCGRPPDVGLL